MNRRRNRQLKRKQKKPNLQLKTWKNLYWSNNYNLLNNSSMKRNTLDFKEKGKTRETKSNSKNETR
jgi:hypothetical protein